MKDCWGQGIDELKLINASQRCPWIMSGFVQLSCAMSNTRCCSHDHDEGGNASFSGYFDSLLGFGMKYTCINISQKEPGSFASTGGKNDPVPLPVSLCSSASSLSSSPSSHPASLPLYDSQSVSYHTLLLTHQDIAILCLLLIISQDSGHADVAFGS